MQIEPKQPAAERPELLGDCDALQESDIEDADGGLREWNVATIQLGQRLLRLRRVGHALTSWRQSRHLALALPRQAHATGCNRAFDLEYTANRGMAANRARRQRCWKH